MSVCDCATRIPAGRCQPECGPRGRAATFDTGILHGAVSAFTLKAFCSAAQGCTTVSCNPGRANQSPSANSERVEQGVVRKSAIEPEDGTGDSGNTTSNS